MLPFLRYWLPGLICAVGIGIGLYSGGVHINLAKFFKITGLVLVFVAAGLLATAAHTAHEAGWISSFQSEAVSLRWLVHPGTVSESLLTGMLGLRPAPTQIEAFVYLAYALPMALFVLWQRGRRTVRRRATEPGVGAARNASISGPFTSRRVTQAAARSACPWPSQPA